MPINGVQTTTDFDGCRMDKTNATSFTVDVSNQYALYQINVAPFGRGENWQPAIGADIGPGYWVFGPADWSQYGVDKAQGIRFKSKVSVSPAVISAA